MLRIICQVLLVSRGKANASGHALLSKSTAQAAVVFTLDITTCVRVVHVVGIFMPVALEEGVRLPRNVPTYIFCKLEVILLVP